MERVIFLWAIIFSFWLGWICLFNPEKIVRIRQWFRPDHDFGSHEEHIKDSKIRRIYTLFLRRARDNNSGR